MTRRIELLGFADVQLLDVTGPLQVFASANDLARMSSQPQPYELVVVGTCGEVKTSSGLVISALPPGPVDAPLDTLIVPGGWGVYAACEDEGLVAWVGGRAKAARRTVSVCSGAFLLAMTGLLDGRRAVTHWGRCDEFKRRFPKVQLEPDPIFIRDDNIWTSAGVTAGIDLALALLADDLGRGPALAVARQLVVFLKRPGGQSQFSAALALQDAGGRFDDLHAWILENLHRPLALPDLAEQAGMSSRTFSRRYRQETGRTPARAVEEMRLESARRQLEQGHPISRIVRRCGFGTEETMRRSFQRRFRISPQAYRERFSA